ncbi:MAG: flagellar basal body L-ring protein FlgH [Myxococcota bacterium]
MKRYGVLMLVWCISCGVGHIKDYSPKSRSYQLPVSQQEMEVEASDGSLFTEPGALQASVADVRALKVNDVVTVQIVESARAERMASTDIERDGGLDAGLAVGLGTRGALNEGLSGQFGLSSSNSGRTARQDSVRFTVAATVRRKLANGNLFVEGHRVVLVNDEEQH